MILVTVGTTQFPFYSMSNIVDEIVKTAKGGEKIIFQHGNTPPIYSQKNIKNIPYVSFQEMQKYINSARIILCHGGPATVYQVLWQSKLPVVVPRQKKYGEHVSNHQVDFCEHLYKHKLALSYKDAKKYFQSAESPVTKIPINHNASIKNIISFLNSQT